MIYIIIFILYILSVIFAYCMTRKELLENKIVLDISLLYAIFLPVFNIGWGLGSILDEKKFKINNEFVKKFFRI